MKLLKIHLRYHPPGLILEYSQKGTVKNKEIDLLDLNSKSDITTVANELYVREVLLTEDVRDQLEQCLTTLKKRIEHEGPAGKRFIPLTSRFYIYKTLMTHVLPLTNVAFDKTGERCLSGSYDRTCKVWDVESGSELATLTGHQNVVYSVSFNFPACDRVITGSFDKSAKIWEPSTGECLATLWGHNGEVVAAQFSPKGDHAATGSMDHTAKLYDVRTGDELHTYTGHTAEVIALQFDPNEGRRLITGSFDGTISIWDTRMKDRVSVLSGHEGEISNVQFNWDSSLVGSSSLDGSARLWDARQSSCLATISTHSDEVTGTNLLFWNSFLMGSYGLFSRVSVLSGHEGEISNVQFNWDSSLVGSSSLDGSARLWDARQSSCLATISTHSDEVTGTNLLFWNSFLMGSYGLFSRVSVLSGHEGEISNVQFNWISSLVGSSSLDGSARLWDARQSSCLATISTHSDDIEVTGTNLLFWNSFLMGSYGLFSRVSVLSGHEGEISNVQFNWDSSLVGSSSLDGSARLWDARQSSCLATISTHSDEVTGTNLLFWNSFLMGSYGLFSRVSVLSGHEGEISNVQFNWDSSLVGSSSLDGSARLWDARQSFCLATISTHSDEVTGTNLLFWNSFLMGSYGLFSRASVLSGHEGEISNVQFNWDSSLVGSSSLDGSARLWDARQSSCLATISTHSDEVTGTNLLFWNSFVMGSYGLFSRVSVLSGHEGEISNVQFNWDSSLVGSSSLDGSARLWDARQSSCLATISTHSDEVTGTNLLFWNSFLMGSYGLFSRVSVLSGHEGEISNVQFNWDSSLVGSSSLDGSARLWDARQSSCLATISTHSDEVTGTNLLFWNSFLMGSYGLFSRVSVLSGHEGEISNVQFNWDSSLVGSSSLDGSARLWDARQSSCLATISTHSDEVTGTNLLFWNSFLMGSYGLFSRVSVLSGHEGEISNVQFNWDSSLVGSSSLDGSARLWDARQSSCLATISTHSDEVLDICFDWAGQRMATSSSDCSARIYDVKGDFKELAIMKGHRDEVSKVCFSPAGGCLLTASADRSARIWNSSTGNCRQVLSGHEGEIFSCAYSYAGDAIITASKDNTCRIWR
ncbi:uncharacterized WD repeat-containing protein alr3466-like [Cydia amplana]|uniref:uncharacterized WD repeat-containing protein alr3466-like n=1 Tax=Cydia amplana TaxID=1869771 RepID=UPI002FE57F3D